MARIMAEADESSRGFFAAGLKIARVAGDVSYPAEGSASGANDRRMGSAATASRQHEPDFRRAVLVLILGADQFGGADGDGIGEVENAGVLLERGDDGFGAVR